MKYLNSVIFLFFWLTAVLPCLAQTKEQDSLKAVFSDSTLESTVRLNAFSKLIRSVVYEDASRAFLLADSMLRFAEKYNDQKGVAAAYNLMGLSYKLTGDYNAAINYYAKSLIIAEGMGDLKAIGIYYNNVGNIHKGQGNYLAALEHHIKALENWKIIDFQNGLAASYNNIGNIHEILNSPDKALEYHFQAKKIRDELSDERGLMDSYGNIGVSYDKLGNVEKALEFYQKSLLLSVKFNNKFKIAASCKSIGSVYFAEEKYSQAMAYFMRCLEINDEIGNKDGLANIHNSIGNLNLAQGNFKNAIKECEKGLNYANYINSQQYYSTSCKCLAAAYQGLGNYRLALQYKTWYYDKQDTINIEVAKKNIEIREYQLKQYNKQIADSLQHVAAINVQGLKIQSQKRIESILLGSLAVLLVFLFLLFKRFQVTRSQKRIIETANRKTKDSIQYAERIQHSILPSMGYIESCLDEFFIMYKPKDIVSGDFYWVYKQKNGHLLIALADCTGHGVPGAFMSMIGTALLNETIIENEVTRVNEVLDTIRNHIIKSFEQEGSKNHVHDGMDIALIDLDPDKRKLSFSGAGQRFYILRDGEVIDVIGNYCPVGYYFGRETPFEIQEIKILPGDQLYLFSDGIIDQFGGDLNKKFTFKQLKEVLLKGAHLPMEEQNKMLDEAVVSWQGDNAQTDDISVMGLRIS